MQVMYTDIWTMPIYNWFKLLDTGNLGFINKSSTLKAPDEVESDMSDDLVEMRHKLNNQFFDEFGQSQTSINILEKKIQLGILKAKFISTQNKMNLTFIEIKENEIEALTPDNKGGFNYNKEVGILSKYMGTMIDVKKTSVHQYNTIKELLKDGN